MAVVVAFALVAGSVGAWLLRGDGDGDEATERHRDGDGQVDTPAGPATEAPPTPEELRAVVDEISVFVAEERGLEFIEPVDVELADDDEFQERLLADFDDEADSLHETGMWMAAFGLVEPDVELVEVYRGLLGDAVIGFYDPETKELVVRGTALTPYVRTTIAHELAHALDDQHAGLHRPEYDDADDEIGFGFSAVIEGNARRIELAYLESLTEEEQRAFFTEELRLGTTMELDGVPPVLFELVGAPYVLGEPFIDALLSEGGEAAVDAAFAEPPTTSEQVLDPSVYLAGEGRVAVAPPEVPGEVVDEGVVGRFLLLVILASELGRGEADSAVEGWGGDWAVLWRDGDRTCVTLTVVGDTPADTDGIRADLEAWAASAGDAEVAPDGPGAPVTVESCAPA